MPRYVEARIYRMLADSSAAEHAARMTAMDAATNNAGRLDRITYIANEQNPPGRHHQGNY